MLHAFGLRDSLTLDSHQTVTNYFGYDERNFSFCSWISRLIWKIQDSSSRSCYLNGGVYEFIKSISENSKCCQASVRLEKVTKFGLGDWITAIVGLRVGDFLIRKIPPFARFR